MSVQDDKVIWGHTVEVMLSNNGKIGSKLISWASKRKDESFSVDEIPSHIAFRFFGKVVCESRMFSGVDVNNYYKFADQNNVVHRYYVSVKSAGKLLDLMLRENRKTAYDYLGAIYLGFKRVAARAFGIELNSNKWDNRHRDFCTELLRYFDEYEKIDLANVVPFDIYLEKKGDNNESN
jgi:hypothetical protein